MIDGLVRHPVASLEQALQLVAFADANRAVYATQMNWSSSRSHAVFSSSWSARRPSPSPTPRRAR